MGDVLQAEHVWASGERLAAQWSQLTSGSEPADLVTAMSNTIVQRARNLWPPDSVVRHDILRNAHQMLRDVMSHV